MANPQGINQYTKRNAGIRATDSGAGQRGKKLTIGDQLKYAKKLKVMSKTLREPGRPYYGTLVSPKDANDFRKALASQVRGLRKTK